MKLKKLWEHYHGGERIKTKGPYKETGEDLIALYRTISKVIKRHQYSEGK